MKIFKVLLTGNNSNTEIVVYFKDELLRLGSNFIKLVDSENEANMKIDISDLDPTCNITEEALEVISTANNLMHYEKKRRKIIKKTQKKVLLASSNIKKAFNRKNIN